MLQWALQRLREKLWLRPLLACLVSILSVWIAAWLDRIPIPLPLPKISVDSLEFLLSVLATSMLVMATFAVGAMVSAYASASVIATPRSVSLVIADDVSQNTLSSFLGAFIFSLVALSALKNDVLAETGILLVSALTILAYTLIIGAFLRWVDRIARLGRMSTTIDAVENAANSALQHYRHHPNLCALPAEPLESNTVPIYASDIGYVQHIDIDALQNAAEAGRGLIQISATPGSFACPNHPLAYWIAEDAVAEFAPENICSAFVIGGDRTYEYDPRLGLLALSEIGSRALSPGVNDPGTAIDVIGTLVRLFSNWAAPCPDAAEEKPKYTRVRCPALSTHDLFDDAFGAIARDGAANVEVMVRLQKGLAALAVLPAPDVREAAMTQSALALERAALAMNFEKDLAAAKRAAPSA